MGEKKSFSIKLTVLIGYILLSAIAILGVYKIYEQLVKFSAYDSPETNRKELNLISNALVSMYQIESVRKVILTQDFNSMAVKKDYNNAHSRVYLYIDSLYKITDDSGLKKSLDTVNILLQEKDKNMSNMIILLDSIKNLPYDKQMLTTVLNRKDLSDLDELLIKRKEIKQDTMVVVGKKKSFFNRLRSVFNDKVDSTQVISKSSTQVNDTNLVLPVKNITDTVVQYFQKFNYRNDKRKILYISRFTARQNKMLFYDEQLSSQINTILRQLETEAKAKSDALSAAKQYTLKRSSDLVSYIGLASILSVLVFLFLTYKLLNNSFKYRRQLEDSKKFAEDLLLSRERLLLMISHDIKSPLSSIIGHIELLSKEKMPEDEKVHIESMRSSSEQILELVSRLLDYHKLEQGKTEINKIVFSPHRLMDDIYKSFLPIAAQKNLQFIAKNNIPEEEHYVSDPHVMRQIINNLITNAVKFTSKGKIEFSSSLSADEKQLKIKVMDTGVGIKDEDKSKIFEEFRRVGETKMQQITDGYGLGLAITYKLVKLLNGEIDFDSKYEEGTVFLISIPLIKPEAGTEAQTINNKDVKESRKVNAKVLFVDDDVAMLNVYNKSLSSVGAEVVTCADSSQVLELLKKNHFDIIFTDIQMPQVNGFELVKKIRNSGLEGSKMVPVIAMSARSDFSEEKFKNGGFTTFISKPVVFESLIEKINNLTQESKTEIKTKLEVKNNKGIYSLIEFVESDRETSVDILNSFVDENKIKLEEFTKALKNKDWEIIKSNAHKMLPLMRMIGADNIVNILIELEKGMQKPEEVIKLIGLVENKNREILKFRDERFV